MRFEHEKVLRLIINGNEFHWEQQYITGADIRKLGNIPESHEIFLKIEKPWEDEEIDDMARTDLARPGLEHFYSKEREKEITIIVNGREKKWEKKEISFQNIIVLAFGAYVDKPTMVYTVAYENGPHKNPEGSMVRGSVVFVKNKMIFHATRTDKS